MSGVRCKFCAGTLPTPGRTSLEVGGNALGLRESGEEGPDVAAFAVRLMRVVLVGGLTPGRDRRPLTTLFGIIREYQSIRIHHRAYGDPARRNDFDCSEWLMLEVRVDKAWAHILIFPFILNIVVTSAASRVWPRYCPPPGRFSVTFGASLPAFTTR